MKGSVDLNSDIGESLGSHLGYPDSMGFGRLSMDISPKEAITYMIY